MTASAGVWCWLGRVPFAATALLQEDLRERVLAGTAAETLLVCEHDPVITLGRGADPSNVLASPDELRRRGIDVHQATRGGDVTYHGPGQLVAYPIFRVRGVVAHVEAMANAVITLLASLGIAGSWRRDLPGVWVGEEKICAFGVHVRHRVAVHGLALNVNTDLAAFETIVPCGLRTTGVTSVARRLGKVAPTISDLAEPFARACEGSFARTLRRVDVP